MSDTDTVSKDGTDGLVTVSPRDYDFYEDGELVTRSQAESEIRKVRKDAEELSSAERAKKKELNRLIEVLVKADAAKDARIKELEEYFVKCISNETFLEQDARRVRQIEALEAKLAADREEIVATLMDAAAIIACFVTPEKCCSRGDRVFSALNTHNRIAALLRAKEASKP